MSAIPPAGSSLDIKSALESLKHAAERTFDIQRAREPGTARTFSFAIYPAARDRYEDAALLTGLPPGRSTRHRRRRPPGRTRERTHRATTATRSGGQAARARPACWRALIRASRSVRSLAVNFQLNGFAVLL
jgi:hypothetical protein